MNELSTNESENSAIGQHCMKSVMIKLFLHYSNSLDRTKIGVLSHTNFLQLLKDAKIVSDTFSVESADLLVRSVLKKQKAFKFNSFCESFFLLSEIVFAEEALISRSEAILQLLTTRVMPLYSSLLARGSILNFELSLTTQLQQLLNTVNKYLLGLYRLYFSWETTSAESTSHIQKLSEKSLFTLLNKYLIYPDIITRSLFKNIWENLLECPPEFISSLPGPSIGKVFTFKKFCSFLVLSASFGSFKVKFVSIHEKFLSLLESMEICSDRTEIPAGCLVISKEPSKQVSPIAKTKTKTKNKTERKEIVIVYNYLKYLGLPKELSFKKFKDLLLNIGIVVDNLYEVELLFAKFQQKGEIELDGFVEMFAKVSEKLCEREDCFNVLLDCVLESPWFLNNKNRLGEYIERISVSELGGVCRKFEKSLKPFLRFYGKNEFFAFEDLIKFCKDFELYPDLFPRTRLDEVFYSFCVGENSEVLSFNSLILVLETCALLAFIPNLTNPDKILSVLERALHSKGPGQAACCKGSNRTSTLMKAANPKILPSKKPPLNSLDMDSILINYNPKP